MANHSGAITSNETWALIDSPHHITADVNVASEAILTIEAGCTVVFDGYYQLWLDNPDSTGSIRAIGTVDSHITFTSKAEFDTPGSGSKGDWSRLYSADNDGANPMILQYCDIGYANYGFGGSPGETSPPEISYCAFHDCNSGTYRIYSGTYNHNTIYDCTTGWYPNQFSGTMGNFLIWGCTTGIYGAGAGLNLLIKNNTIYDCGTGVYQATAGTTINIRNCIVTGCTIGLNEYNGTMASTYSCYYDNVTDFSSSPSSGVGDIFVDPKYADSTPEAIDEFRLQSVYGRWNGSSWVIDGSTSPCVSTGKPEDDFSNEPVSSRINMGFEGNTEYASYDAPGATEVISDIANDFRSLLLWAIDDVTNDFRMVGSELTYDVTNDFRMQGAEVHDIDNDFRMTEISYTFGDLTNDIRIALSTRIDINNKFNFVGLLKSDINNDMRSVGLLTEDVKNDMRTVGLITDDITNDIRTKSLSVNDVTNDFRMVASWQVPGGVGFESLGKEYIKVYFDDVEQTDIDVDSITITQNLGAPHTCDFDLARAYDGTTPALETVVEVKYHVYTLYKGYIVSSSPTDRPEKITIHCEDKYWDDNRTNVFFNVGHKPPDDKEVYYETIAGGLSAIGGMSGWNVGSFIPQTINCFGVGAADAVTALVTKCGNYNWYYDVAQNKKLWKAGAGSIVELEAQEIGSNLGLYQVLNHSITESIAELVNKLRVQCGEKVIRRFQRPGTQAGDDSYTTSESEYYLGYAWPKWEEIYEKIHGQLDTGYGFDRPKLNTEYLYNDVFTRYELPGLDPEMEEWSDKKPPIVQVFTAVGEDVNVRGIPTSPASWDEHNGYIILNSGFTIDYEKGELILSQPLYHFTYKTDYGREKWIDYLTAIRIWVRIWKIKYYTVTQSDDTIIEDPTEDVSNPLMFFTSKYGTYPTTILKAVNYGQFSIQTGYSYRDEDGEWITVPSWNDMAFAQDLANWEVSQTCDIKTAGNIQLTIDAACYYGLELNKRINIDGVLDNPLNIKSITYNVSDFTVTIALENGRTYTRTTSLPWHGA